MGQGIAQVSAMAGYEVLLYDLNKETLEQAIQKITSNLDKGIARGKVTDSQRNAVLQLISISSDKEKLTGDIIIEAILEKLDIKQELFVYLEEINSEETILASNTSSIPITRIAAKLRNPERFVGLHFFNPAHIMKLVEVISGVSTDQKVAETAYDLAKKLGKQPVMAADAPGFIVNRVARHFYVEGLKLLEENVASVEAIDRLVESSGFKMGPFRLMDLIGVDSNFLVTKSMFEAFHYDSKFRPSRIQQKMVDARRTGRKSGKGFYDYN